MEEEINRQVGKNVAKMRTMSGLNQQETGKQLGLHRASIINIEQGRQAVTLSNLYKMCVLFGCQITDILPPANVPSIPEELKAILEQWPEEKGQRAYHALRIILSE